MVAMTGRWSSASKFVKKVGTTILAFLLYPAGVTSLGRYSLSAGVDRSIVRDLGHPDSSQLACGAREAGVIPHPGWWPTTLVYDVTSALHHFIRWNRSQVHISLRRRTIPSSERFIRRNRSRAHNSSKRRSILSPEWFFRRNRLRVHNSSRRRSIPSPELLIRQTRSRVCNCFETEQFRDAENNRNSANVVESSFTCVEHRNSSPAHHRQHISGWCSANSFLGFRSPRKTADLWHRPARFPCAENEDILGQQLRANPLRLQGRKIMQGDMHRCKEGLDSHGLHVGAMTTSLKYKRSPNYCKEQNGMVLLYKCEKTTCKSQQDYTSRMVFDEHLPLYESPEKTETINHMGPRWLSKRLARPLPTKANLVQSRPGHRIFASGNRAGRCRWSAGFLGDIPFPTPLHSSAAPYSLQSPSSALKTSLLRAAQISSLTITPHGFVYQFMQEFKERVGGAKLNVMSSTVPAGKHAAQNTRDHPRALAARCGARKTTLGYTSRRRESRHDSRFAFFTENIGAAMTERLAFSPSTKAIRIQSPAGSLRIFACRNYAGRCRWSAGFLVDLPFPMPFRFGAAPYSPQSPSSNLKTSMLRAVQISSLTENICRYRLFTSLLNSRYWYRQTSGHVRPLVLLRQWLGMDRTSCARISSRFVRLPRFSALRHAIRLPATVVTIVATRRFAVIAYLSVSQGHAVLQFLDCRFEGPLRKHRTTEMASGGIIIATQNIAPDNRNLHHTHNPTDVHLILIRYTSHADP
ncbi:hypothetical protein PR048_009618 [Dryococelus australis]|uniref:Uncharacterized protein n=1 Tax=Dryococelus australis TaxID=614101 RepID=A0ABQ9I0E7_9NEOP|nr:hypothetical protein PR048_009618 [Dryococelus australis]